NGIQLAEDGRYEGCAIGAPNRQPGQRLGKHSNLRVLGGTEIAVVLASIGQCHLERRIAATSSSRTDDRNMQLDISGVHAAARVEDIVPHREEIGIAERFLTVLNTDRVPSGPRGK